MSIADKLVTIAEKLPKVYHAGQLNVLANAESLNGKLQGTTVKANDVANIEHNVPCVLTSDTITDFSQVEVSRYGKNLLPYPLTNTTQTASGITYIYEGGTIIANGTTTNGSYFNLIGVTNPITLPVGTYTISGLPNDVPRGVSLWLRDVVNGVQGNKYTRNTITVTEPTDFYVYITISSNVTVDNLVIKPQLEVGDTPTTYEPFKEPTTYQSTADGVVDGITSIAPNMTLLTNAEGVIINANYYKDPDIVISNLAQSVALSGGEG